MTHQPSFEIVVAHYNEDLSWLDGAIKACTIYSKGGDKNAPTHPHQKLPNIGREGHTYLHHIVHNYDTLTEVTIFLQGRIDDHVSISLAELIKRSLTTKDGQVMTFPFRELELFDLWDGFPWELYPCWSKWNSMECLRAPMTPGQYWQHFFPNKDMKIPAFIGFQPGALFAVHKSTIQQYPHSFYEKLLNELFLGDMAHINPETGHFWERFWLAMWNPKEYVSWHEDDVAKEERNEQGQLAKGKWHRTPRNVDVDEYISGPAGTQIKNWHKRGRHSFYPARLLPIQHMQQRMQKH
ncbi:uncharacterized protein KY384_009228 [Bacidia gigantensis]|uniref:uncharacterized protein n=1 Tax=Bacidia gigantensis TaxID=2732470 RepID=UPI001D04926C|nr:uncharacterized protein KY384_009228 [Bacidia gigantensis]KAG8525584.1 hypothetical protein KY384_009228 [Bacidia gigantensis]